MRPAPLHKLVGDVRLVVRGAIEPSDEEFEAHVSEALAMAGAVRVVLVVYAPGTRISAKQRARLVRAGLFDVPHAVLTDALVAKGEITAVGALGVPVRTFARHEFEQACDFLAIPPRARPDLVQQIALMNEELARFGLLSTAAAGH